MSEHWKSTPKYWCKHCSTYVKDTPFEKKQHEATGKHQGNLRRFLNGIQKDHAKNEKEKIQAKAEIERLNRIAGTSATEFSTGTSSLLSAPKTANATTTNLSAADQKRQWAQLAEMGIAVPNHAGVDSATPGGWQTVSQKVVHEAAQSTDEKLNIGIRKRKLEDQEESEDAGEMVVRRGWGSTTKTYPASNPTHDDLDTLLAASVLKTKKSLRQSAQEDTKEVESLVTDSKAGADGANNGAKVDLLPPDLTLAVVSGSTGMEPSDKEDKSQILYSTEVEAAIPVFKKRRSKR